MKRLLFTLMRLLTLVTALQLTPNLAHCGGAREPARLRTELRAAIATPAAPTADLNSMQGLEASTEVVDGSVSPSLGIGFPPKPGEAANKGPKSNFAPPAGNPAPTKSPAFGIASFVCGVLSYVLLGGMFLFAGLWPLMVVSAAAAMVLGAIGSRRSRKGRKLALLGIGLGSALLWYLVMGALLLLLFPPDFQLVLG